jgi:1,2-diacylglycerol 3-beta-galactosyltransferase
MTSSQPPTANRQQHIVILFSDTGGGHRASGEAIQEALTLKFNDRVTVSMVDVFKKYTPYPFNRFPAWYPAIIARGIRVWGAGFKVSDGRQRSRVLTNTTYPYTRWSFRRFLKENPADLYVSVHPLLTMPAVRALGKGRPPFITVVTDLVSAHAFWFYPKVDEIIVPTQGAFERAVKHHVPADKLKVVGLPISQKFCAPPGDKKLLRQTLGWQTDRTTVLVVGGGEGMGPLYDIARGIASAGLPIQIVIVAGRNESLREKLQNVDWEIPTQVYGFVTNMPDLMRASDLIVTKAGPSSVVEAINAGLPIVLSSALPGQEEGNVRFVVDNGAGVWAPTPQKVVAAVKQMLAGELENLKSAAANARRIARPTAALDIADEIVKWLPVGDPRTDANRRE